MNHRFNHLLIRCIDWISLLFLIPLFFRSLFVFYTVDFNTFVEVTVKKDPNPAVTMLLLLGMIFLFMGIAGSLRTADEKLRWKIAYGVMGVCALAVLVCGIFWIRTNPYEWGPDQRDTWLAAGELAAGNGRVQSDLEYFDTYPGQKKTAVAFSWIIRLIGNDSNRFCFLNVLLAAAFLVFSAWIVKEITSSAEALVIVCLLSCSFFPLIFYCSFVYGLTLSLAFSAVSAYGIIRYLKTEKMIWLLPPLILLPLSNLFYPGVFIFNLAAAAVLFMGALEIKSRQKWAAFAAILLIMLFMFLSGKLTSDYFDKTMGKEELGDGIPVSAYIVMGLESEEGACGEGSYNVFSNDVYSESGYDTALAEKKCREIIKKDIGEYLRGERSLRFFRKKMEIQWLDPWFGGLTMTIKSPRTSSEKHNRFMESGALPAAEKYLYILMVFVYFSALCCQIVRILSPRTDIISRFPNIHFIGGFLFQFFWEQKSRYCLHYFLALILLAVMGIISFSKIFRKMKQTVCVLSGKAYAAGRKMNRWKRYYMIITAVLSLLFLITALTDRKVKVIPEAVFHGETGRFHTNEAELQSGDYSVTLYYTTEEDMTLYLCLEGYDEEYPTVLAKNGTELTFPMYLGEDTNRIHFEYEMTGQEMFQLNKIIFEADRLRITYKTYIAVLFPILSVLFYFIAAFVSGRKNREKA